VRVQFKLLDGSLIFLILGLEVVGRVTPRARNCAMKPRDPMLNHASDAHGVTRDRALAPLRYV